MLSNNHVLSVFRHQYLKVVCKSSELFKTKSLHGSQRFFTKSSTCCQELISEVVKEGNLTYSELKIPVSWGHIAAKQWGTPTGTPVLAVHGWQDNAGTFDTLAPLLPKDWNLLCIDLPGHGLSSHFPKGFVYYVSEYIMAIRQITAFFNWKKFDYIGHSMGAGIGLLYSAIFNEDIDHLVSLDLVKGISLESANPRLQKDLAKFFVERNRFQKEEDANRPAPILPIDDAVKKVIKSVNGSLTEESVKILMKRGAEFLPGGKIRFTRDRKLTLPISAVSILSTEQIKKLIEFMHCHLLIIKAKQGPMYEKAEVYDEFKVLYAKCCKTFKYIEVDGTHHVHLNNPENVVDHIIKFIK